MSFDSKVSLLQNHALSPSFFGKEIIYRPLNGGFFTLKGIQFDDFLSEDKSMDVEVFLQQQNIDVKLSEMNSNPIEGDILEVGPQKFKVNSVKFDGLGMATLFLYKL